MSNVSTRDLLDLPSGIYYGKGTTNAPNDSRWFIFHVYVTPSGGDKKFIAYPLTLNSGFYIAYYSSSTFSGWTYTSDTYVNESDISTIQVDSDTKVPSSSLVYSMNNTIVGLEDLETAYSCITDISNKDLLSYPSGIYWGAHVTNGPIDSTSATWLYYSIITNSVGTHKKIIAYGVSTNNVYYGYYLNGTMTWVKDLDRYAATSHSHSEYSLTTHTHSTYMPMSYIETSYSSSTTKVACSKLVNDLKTSVSDGKSAIASAITGKGGSASGSDTFAQLATAIGNLATVGIITDTSKITGNTYRTIYVYKTALSYVPNNYLFISTRETGRTSSSSNPSYQVSYFGKINGSYYMEAYTSQAINLSASDLLYTNSISNIDVDESDSRFISYTIISNQSITTGYTLPCIMIYW